jgi:hypothetical protein
MHTANVGKQSEKLTMNMSLPSIPLHCGSTSSQLSSGSALSAYKECEEQIQKLKNNYKCRTVSRTPFQKLDCHNFHPNFFPLHVKFKKLLSKKTVRQNRFFHTNQISCLGFISLLEQSRNPLKQCVRQHKQSNM